MTHQDIKKQLQELIVDQKKTITVEWDCGHDEAPLWFYINDEKVPFNHPLEDLLEALNDLILVELELPNAVPYSEKGSGVLGFNTENNLFIIFENTRIEDAAEQLTWKNDQVINTSKYQNKHIPLQDRVDLPFMIDAAKEEPIAIDLDIRADKKVEIYGSKFSEEEKSQLREAFLAHEEERLERELLISEKDYIVEMGYSIDIHINYFIIKEINIFYEIITRRWKDEKKILIK